MDPWLKGNAQNVIMIKCPMQLYNSDQQMKDKQFSTPVPDASEYFFPFILVTVLPLT